MTEVKIKTCRKCGITSDLVEFPHNKRVCRPCINEYSKIYKNQHKEEMELYRQSVKIKKANMINNML